METKLNCILLIDDDEATNFLHKIVIEETGCAEKTVAVQSGEEGLNFLNRKENGEFPQPDLILLDINMPGMNGWEFMEEYKKLDVAQKGKFILVMLTSSPNPDDRLKAESIDLIDDFKCKPLTEEMITEILKNNSFH